MHSKLDHLRIFKAVAESGSLSEAAKLLNRTPSAISMSLKQFTEQLGDELFETDRKSTLTPLGHFVLDQSRNVLNDVDEAMETIQRYARGDFGTIRIASVPSFSTRLLPNIVKQFNRAMPSVRLELRDIDSDLINKAVRNGIVDFGIASQLDTSHKLKTQLLFEEPFGVVCKARHSLSKAKSKIRWDQLTQEQFISNDFSRLMNNAYVETLSKNAKLHIHNIASLLSFTAEGFGVTLLPQSAVPERDDLCFLSLQDSTVVRQLFIIEHKNRRFSPAAKLLKQQIIDYFKGAAR